MRPGLPFRVAKPYFGTATEVHAAAAPAAPTAAYPAAAASFVRSASPGVVPGRAVLDVPGWQDTFASLPGAAPAMAGAAPVGPRLRIFSGSSNRVSVWAACCPGV